MERLYGLSGAEVIGKALREVFPSLQGTIEEEHLNRALAGTPSRSGIRFITPPRSPESRFLEAHYAPVRGEDGVIIGGFAILHDVTESRRAEEQREESESRFRTMADGAPVLLWMSEPGGLCTFFNQGWLDFTGRTLEMEWGNGW